MTKNRFNRKPEELKKSISSKQSSTVSLQKLKNFLGYSEDKLIKELMVTNAVLERLLLKYLKDNIDLEKRSEERNNPFFYFNKN